MGSAIVDKAREKYDFLVFDKDPARLPAAGDGVTPCAGTGECLAQSQAVILAVKPQDFEQVLSVIKYSVSDKLVVSIAAGIRTSSIEKIVGKARVVRVMPNLAVKVGMGMSCVSKGAYANQQDVNFVTSLFNLMGKTLVIDEKMMDAATAVSGSGPGFLLDQMIGKNAHQAQIDAKHGFQDELKEAAARIGFTPQQALVLAAATTDGTIKLVNETGEQPQALRDKVTSKGGTTAAGLEVLHRGGSLEEAVEAAKKKAEELSQ